MKISVVERGDMVRIIPPDQPLSLWALQDLYSCKQRLESLRRGLPHQPVVILLDPGRISRSVMVQWTASFQPTAR